MNKVLLIPYGWIGDRFFTTSVAVVLKRYMENGEIYFLSTPEFSFMDDIIGSMDCIDRVVTTDEAAQIQFDYVFEMPHTNHAESPIVTYCREILQTNEFSELNMTPEFVKKEKLVELTGFTDLDTPYVTYQVDWQLRTRLNVQHIIEELERNGVRCVPIGKFGLSNQGNPLENKQSFHDTLVKVAHAKYHLAMLGGTAVMATYVNTPTILSMDHYFYKHNEHNYDVDKFMEWWGLSPYTISGNSVHQLMHPFTTEEQFITYTLERFK